MVVFGLPIQLVVALALAVLLNQRLPGERIFRAALYMPVVLALNAAVLLCWRLMLNANNGLQIQRHGLWRSDLVVAAVTDPGHHAGPVPTPATVGDI